MSFVSIGVKEYEAHNGCTKNTKRISFASKLGDLRGFLLFFVFHCAIQVANEPA